MIYVYIGVIGWDNVKWYRLGDGDGDDSFARTLSRFIWVFGVRTAIQIRYAFVCMRTKVGYKSGIGIGIDDVDIGEIFPLAWCVHQ